MKKAQLFFGFVCLFVSECNGKAITKQLAEDLQEHGGETTIKDLPGTKKDILKKLKDVYDELDEFQKFSNLKDEKADSQSETPKNSQMKRTKADVLYEWSKDIGIELNLVKKGLLSKNEKDLKKDVDRIESALNGVRNDLKLFKDAPSTENKDTDSVKHDKTKKDDKKTAVEHKDSEETKKNVDKDNFIPENEKIQMIEDMILEKKDSLKQLKDIAGDLKSMVNEFSAAKADEFGDEISAKEKADELYERSRDLTNKMKSVLKGLNSKKDVVDMEKVSDEIQKTLDELRGDLKSMKDGESKKKTKTTEIKDNIVIPEELKKLLLEDEKESKKETKTAEIKDNIVIPEELKKLLLEDEKDKDTIPAKKKDVTNDRDERKVSKQRDNVSKKMKQEDVEDAAELTKVEEKESKKETKTTEIKDNNVIPEEVKKLMIEDAEDAKRQLLQDTEVVKKDIEEIKELIKKKRNDEMNILKNLDENTSEDTSQDPPTEERLDEPLKTMHGEESKKETITTEIKDNNVIPEGVKKLMLEDREEAKRQLLQDTKTVKKDIEEINELTNKKKSDEKNVLENLDENTSEAKLSLKRAILYQVDNVEREIKLIGKELNGIKN